MADDRLVLYKELTLNGRLRTADDPAELISEGGVVDYQSAQKFGTATVIRKALVEPPK